MKFSLSWLKDYIDVTMDPADLADALTMAGLEVDSVSNRYGYLNGVIVARVEEVSRHPNADNLSLCRVNTGESQVSVVCGATQRQGWHVRPAGAAWNGFAGWSPA